jgi:hypothetical protein
MSRRRRAYMHSDAIKSEPLQFELRLQRIEGGAIDDGAAADDDDERAVGANASQRADFRRVYGGERGAARGFDEESMVVGEM